VNQPALHHPKHPVRFVTAASLFDGHDAAINIMRRILQAQGAEVIHLGHDRSVAEVVTTAISEDVQGIAISSYQGGHLEYFAYLREQLDAAGAGHVKIFGGGGGVIVPDEIDQLRAMGVRIFSPQDGQRLGLDGMINELIVECDVDLTASPVDWAGLRTGSVTDLARAITILENGSDQEFVARIRQTETKRAVVLGITGTGGSGKSSLTDEIVRRMRSFSEDKLRVAVLAIDPTRRRGGGALLGDRIRMNSIYADNIYFRSIAMRSNDSALPEALDDMTLACSLAGFDVVIIETPGVGQGDSGVVDHCDVSLYVMTPEYGAASQLEKIDMLDFADVVAVNKSERRGAEDARRDVARQMLRNRSAFDATWQQMPVFLTSAAHFADGGVDRLSADLMRRLQEHGLPTFAVPDLSDDGEVERSVIVPRGRERHHALVSDLVRSYHASTNEHIDTVRRIHALRESAKELHAVGHQVEAELVEVLAQDIHHTLDEQTIKQLTEWPLKRSQYGQSQLTYTIRGRQVHAPLTRTTQSHLEVPRVALPPDDEPGAIIRFLRNENLPGHFPYTAGVFPLKRAGETPARMFAGEGDPAHTNARFKLLSKGQPAIRLSTAFDSVTLYGRDPSTQPDIYGKVGTSGVSVATLDDMKAVYEGFNLSAPDTSVSMTINGPAPTILAMYFNAAIDQQVEAFTGEHGRAPDSIERDQLLRSTVTALRGTLQADILKEDQGQNTCLFSTEFSLRCMADIQQWFIDHDVENFYSVSISGYHIAEAGANPISQLAFTLANGFTYVESYLARGMAIDDFAPNLSFFFSNGMDIEYTVLGRVARRIWAIAMRDVYGANVRSQQLKYHIQTSGRSLHAQEMDFNDIRTTLQALCAIYDNANSLHTNAYDEAVTTPSSESVRRALAIQMIIDAEWGVSMNENPLQGSFLIDELTDLVEEAVLVEFERIADRGGVLGAMETGYQRGKIQDESMQYEHGKHNGTIPIVGVNTFLADESAPADDTMRPVVLARGTDDQRASQLARLAHFTQRNQQTSEAELTALKQAALAGDNVFAALMTAVRHCTLGQITEAFFEVGGQYRRTV